MTRTALALALAALVLAGCRSPINLGGEYRARSHDLVKKSPDKLTLIEDDRWTFLWGIFDSGDMDVHWQLERQLRSEDECFVDLEVREYTTIPGYILGWLTAGIVSHQEVKVRGQKAWRAPASEREKGTWDETKPSGKSQPD